MRGRLPFHERYPDCPTLAEARAMQPPPEDRSRPGEVVWGPIGIEDAAAAGSRMPSASVVLRGIVDDQLRSAATRSTSVLRGRG